jgi:hypothetical protein
LGDSDATTPQILHELANPVEAMTNILYLIKEERYDPDKIMQLANLADEPLHRISEILRRSLS